MHAGGASRAQISIDDCLVCTDVVCTATVPTDSGPPSTSTRGTAPAPLRRVMVTASNWLHTEVWHTLYLPDGTPPPGGWPVLVEFPGNYCNAGAEEQYNDCGGNWTMQGWGAGAYTGKFIWITLPFLTADNGNKTSNQIFWWGCRTGGNVFGADPDCSNTDQYNPNTTVAYAKDAIKETLSNFGGNPAKVVSLGHSRGAIATQAIGGWDNEIASLWAGIIGASHWDAIGTENWVYGQPMGGTDGAIARAQRLAHVPKFLVGECDIASNVDYLWLTEVANLSSNIIAWESGFRDHTGFWIARPSPSGARKAMRSWLLKLLDME